MAIDKKILEEINRYKKINNYILEQEAAPPPADAPPAEGLPPTDAPPPALGAEEGTPPPPPAGDTEATAEPEKVDVETDPDVEKIGEEGEESEEGDETEELDVTELVTTQKDFGQKQDGYFEELFAHLERLESKLSEMDNLVNKINQLEATIERSRPKTPQEKLELRSLDSGPFNQKLTDFFVDKEADLQKSGKNEYVLKPSDVEHFSSAEVRDSFNVGMEDNFGV